MNSFEFDTNFHHPDAEGISSLYRFRKYDINHPEYLSQIFIEKKLYHPTPDQFNDAFECKPFWNWPTNPNKIREIRKHLIKTLRGKGILLKKAEALVSNFMRNRESAENVIFTNSHKTFAKIRICSFTKELKNLLHWSHYADSHKGFCIKFDATKMPFAGAFKVKYQSDFPEIEYPMHRDRTNLSASLTKSKEWEYEQEFRTIFYPDAKSQPKNDGKSLLLEGDEITDIYFGAKIDYSHKEKIIELIKDGPFNPKLYDTVLSKFSYSLTFNRFS